MGGPGLGNYDEVIASGWREFFSSLPHRARVLDLCTGNGAIPLIALEVSRHLGTSLSITGVDKADIDPQRYAGNARVELEQVTFLGNVRAEQLPLPKNSYDAVVSQYGFEYTDMPSSAAEVVRVLKGGGRVRLLTHAAEGIVAERARAALRDAEFLLSDVDLPGAAARCLEAVVQPTQSAAAHESVRIFETALAGTATYLHTAADQAMLLSSASVLVDTYNKRSRFDLETLLGKVAEVRTEILAHKSRLMALLESALDADRLKQIAGELEAAGLCRVRCRTVAKESDVIGYVIEARSGDPK
jgi:SAM-dependent methyltransferase